jgi:hypothetical protein
MTRAPDEPSSWREDPDPETVVRDLRDQIRRAQSRMREHRDQMYAAGLTHIGGDQGPRRA